jgi:hypothetical protein
VSYEAFFSSSLWGKDIVNTTTAIFEDRMGGIRLCLPPSISSPMNLSVANLPEKKSARLVGTSAWKSPRNCCTVAKPCPEKLRSERHGQCMKTVPVSSLVFIMSARSSTILSFAGLSKITFPTVQHHGTAWFESDYTSFACNAVV